MCYDYKGCRAARDSTRKVWHAPVSAQGTAPRLKERGVIMDIQAIIQAIGTLGFPIVACCALFYQNWKQDERHKDEMDRVTTALNNNTVALTELSTLIKEKERAGNDV